MFRVMGFFALMIALMAVWGELYTMALLFFAQTAAFVAFSYMKLTEKTYMYLLFSYMIISFLSYSYYAFFMMEPGSAGEHALSVLSLL